MEASSNYDNCVVFPHTNSTQENVQTGKTATDYWKFYEVSNEMRQCQREKCMKSHRTRPAVGKWAFSISNCQKLHSTAHQHWPLV